MAARSLRDRVRETLLDIIFKLIPHTHYRLDKSWISWIGFDFLTQPPDMGIYHSLIAKKVISPHIAQKLVTGQSDSPYFLNVLYTFVELF